MPLGLYKKERERERKREKERERERKKFEYFKRCASNIEKG